MQFIFFLNISVLLYILWGIAIIWNSTIKHKLDKIDSIINRACGLLYGENDSLIMLLNTTLAILLLEVT